MTKLTRLALLVIPILASSCAPFWNATLDQSSVIATLHMNSHEEVKTGTWETCVVRGSSEIRIDETKKIQMWTDLNVRYRRRSDAKITSRIKVYHGQSLVHTCQDDPTDPISRGGTFMFVTCSFKPDYWSPIDMIYQPGPNRPGIETKRFQRLLDSDFIPATPGIYRFEVEQTFQGVFVEINKTDLIIKQKFR